jgi:hypothetical protein
LLYTSLEVSHVFDPGLQYGQFVHFHTFAGWNHVFQHAELFIHFTPPPTLNNAVGGFAGNLPARGTGHGGLFAF